MVREIFGIGLIALGLAALASAQTAQEKPFTKTLQSLNASLEEVTKKVFPAVVHIEVVSYGPLSDEEDDGKVQTLSRRAGSGSGVIVDSSGYVVTAMHVVEGARRVRVNLDSRALPEPTTGRADDSKHESWFEARIVGAFKDADVAVLKIDAHDLPTVSFSDLATLRQGEMVAALGSPEGLRNSVSWGVVSAVARQIEPDDSILYIQTDASLAPGCSGGPLVNVEGEMVGMDVFTITEEQGRDERLGFAVPNAMLRFVYEQIRKYGHVSHPYLGLNTQGITPILAAALHLPAESGVIVSGVPEDSSADKLALQPGDVILTFDGTRLQNVPQLTWELLHKREGDRVRLGVWRKSGTITYDVFLVSVPDEPDESLAAMDIEGNLVPKLGIVGFGPRPERAKDGVQKPNSGVLVVARLRGIGPQPELSVGDLIHAVNAVSVTSVSQLRALLDTFQPGNAVALQVERKGKLMYVAFEMD